MPDTAQTLSVSARSLLEQLDLLARAGAGPLGGVTVSRATLADLATAARELRDALEEALDA